MTVRILVGDCRELMAAEPVNSVDAIVTDPPYDLLSVSRNGSRRIDPPNNPYGRHGERGGFMGMTWDATGVAFEANTWAAALRILKPGGHLLAFGGTRTFHRLTCAIEDAGFEIRDVLSWLYGSGFPKSLDVSKAIDKAAGVEREIVGRRIRHGDARSYTDSPMNGGRYGRDRPTTDAADITAAATEDATRWSGWGTALKPAWEPIILARKPLSEPNVAANVLRWGTGALNIDGCRIGESKNVPASPSGSRHVYNGGWRDQDGARGVTDSSGWNPNVGRWPANVALNEQAAAVLDEQSGELTSGANPTRRGSDKFRGIYAPFLGQTECEPARGAESGGASRFFYTAKASASERRPDQRHAAGERNTHPTVKPVDLMRWLVCLVTPPGGLVCDPFMGSGSTGIAASRQGFGFLGMEQSAEYAEIARQRIVSDAPMFVDLEAGA